MEHFYRGSGSIIRKALQQLEAAGLIEKKDKGVHKGRVITGKGMSLLDQAASKIYKPVGKKAAKKEVPKVEEKAAEPKKEEVKEAPKAEEKPKAEAKEEKPEAKKE